MDGQSSRPNWSGWMGCIAMIAGASLLAVLGTRLFHSDLPQLPALLENLPPHGEAKFTERLRDRFPIGSPESALIQELWLEGFQPATDLSAPLRKAGFDRPGDFIHDACRRWGTVHWSAEATGRLTAISGIFSVDCP